MLMSRQTDINKAVIVENIFANGVSVENVALYAFVCLIVSASKKITLSLFPVLA